MLLKDIKKKTFLTRLGNTTRKVTNQSEVGAFLEKNGFNIVDTSNMSIQQQIDIFSKTGYLIGIHGAGMTNMIFRRNASLNILEHYPGNFRNKDHERIAKEYGYAWDTLSDIPATSHLIHTEFYVPMDQLADKLSSFLNTVSSDSGNGHKQLLG